MTYKHTKGIESDGANHASETMSCPLCGKLTTRAALSNYGARCFRCFDAYCQEEQRPRPRSAAAERIRSEIEAAGKPLPA